MSAARSKPRRVGRHPGKRLSPWRVLLGITIVLVAIAAAVAGPWYAQLNAPTREAEAGPRWAGGYFDVTAAHVTASATIGDGTDGAVVLAFVVAAASDRCEPSWGSFYSLSEAGRELDLDRRVDTMRRDGAHVVVSFGGALNTELASACATVPELQAAYREVLERYNVATIDLDIEGPALADTEAGARRAAAIARLQSERYSAEQTLDVWLTLPTTPEGLTSEGLAAIQQLLDAGVILRGVNAMVMDYGVALGGRTMGAVAIDALGGIHDQLTELYGGLRIALPAGGAWALMGATPMIGQNDVTSEVFRVADAQALSTFAHQVGLARMSLWSLNRDRECGPNYPDVSVVSDACSGVRQDPREFDTVLRQGYLDAPEDVATPEPEFTPVPDDPRTAPYPLWEADRAYSAGVRVVWHGYVYQAKWWIVGEPEPDDPTQSAEQTSWVLVGAVSVDDEPFTLPTVPPGTYPEWSATEVYEAAARVVVDNVPYEAKWWTQGDDPTVGITDYDRSPWRVVDDYVAEDTDAGTDAASDDEAAGDTAE